MEPLALMWTFTRRDESLRQQHQSADPRHTMLTARDYIQAVRSSHAKAISGSTPATSISRSGFSIRRRR